MSDPFDTEIWLPDLVERCQDAIRHSWYADMRGPCWYISRSAIERLLQEDEAGNDLPASWRKLLVAANLPPEFATLPDSPRFAADDFEELERWTQRLGPKLDLSPEPVSIPAVDVPKPPSLRVGFAFAAAIILVALGVSAYWSARLSRSTLASRVLSTRLANVLVTAQIAQTTANREGQNRLQTLRKLDLLESENHRLKSEAVVSPPQIDLSSLLLPRNAGLSSGWDVRSPAFTAIRKSPVAFTWPVGKSATATLLLFDERSHKQVWSHQIDLGRGLIVGIPKLATGRTYLWSIVTESDDEGYSAVPFYILSSTQVSQLDRSLSVAKSDIERASTIARFGLFDELGPFGNTAKRHFAL